MCFKTIYSPLLPHMLHDMLSVADDSHSTNDNVDEFSSDYMANGTDNIPV